MQRSLIDIIRNHSFQVLFFTVSLISTVVSIVQFGVSIPYALIGLCVLTILYLLAVLQHVHRAADEVPPDVLLFHLILPTDGLKPFYNMMIDCMSKCLESLHDRNWLLCPRIPSSSFDKLDIWQKYERIAGIRKTAGGVFLLADDPDDNFDKIIGNTKATLLPTVMIDVYFDLSRYDERSRAQMPPFVGGDEKIGGQIAAEIVVSYLRKTCLSEQVSKIIIIKGGNTGWETQRISSFKLAISSEMCVEYLETDFLFYSRADAYNEIYRIFCGVSAKELGRCHAIFAANDDMAIGARNALKDVSRLRGADLDIAIVGYDGAPEMKNLIDRHDEHLIGTVDVRVEEQAKRAVALMKELASGHEPREKIHLVPPRMYVRPF